jgi:hypothetical protein
MSAENLGSGLSDAILRVVENIVAVTGLGRSEFLYNPERSPAPDIGKLAFGVELTANTDDYNDNDSVRINHTLLVAFSRELATSDEFGTQLATLDQQAAIIASAGIRSEAAGYGPVRLTFEGTTYTLSPANERLVVVMRFAVVHDIHRQVA